MNLQCDRDRLWDALEMFKRSIEEHLKVAQNTTPEQQVLHNFWMESGFPILDDIIARSKAGTPTAFLIPPVITLTSVLLATLIHCTDCPKTHHDALMEMLLEGIEKSIGFHLKTLAIPLSEGTS